MNKSQVKRMVGFGGLAVASLAVLLMTARLGGLIENARTGADLEDTLSVLEVPVSADAITWLRSADLARPLDATARDAIGEAYLLGLGILDGLVEVSSEDYAVHLTGAALRAAQTRIPAAAPLQTSHTMRITFYSADGQVVELEDDAASTFVASESLITRNEQAIAVLVLIDGVWHLRHRVLTGLETDLMSIP